MARSLLGIGVASWIVFSVVAGMAMDTKADDGKLRIIVFGAHPDDAEFKAGGTAALWAKQGHHVKLVSVTNGDIGHWQMAGGPSPSAGRPKWPGLLKFLVWKARC